MKTIGCIMALMGGFSVMAVGVVILGLSYVLMYDTLGHFGLVLNTMVIPFTSLASPFWYASQTGQWLHVWLFLGGTLGGTCVYCIGLYIFEGPREKTDQVNKTRKFIELDKCKEPVLNS